MTDHNSNKTPNSLLYSQSLTQVLGADVMQILRCGICMEFFQVPIVLPCGHTFCLHCLTQMCTHASLNQVPGSTKDVRIGCPNCRVLIYATPILRRNVTCNFIVQSLIESLKVRQDSRPNMQSRGVNTEVQEKGDGHGSNFRPELSVLSLTSSTDDDTTTARLLGEFDQLTNVLGNSKPSVVDMAFMEIEEIRSDHLYRERQRQADRDAKTRDQVRAVQTIMKKSREDHQKHHQHHQMLQRQQPQRQILTRPQQQQTKSLNFCHSNTQPRIENTNDFSLLQPMPSGRKPPFPNSSICDKNTYSVLNQAPNQTQEKARPSTKHAYSQPYHQRHQTDNHGIPLHSNPLQQFSMHEPPPKCRKMSVTLNNQTQQLESKPQQDVIKVKNTAAMVHRTNTADNYIPNIVTSATPFKDGGASGDESCLLKPHPKLKTSGDSQLNNDPAIMSFSLKTQPVKQTCGNGQTS